VHAGRVVAPVPLERMSVTRPGRAAMRPAPAASAHVEPGGDAVAGQRRQRRVVGEVDVQSIRPAAAPAGAVDRRRARLVGPDAVAVD